MSKYSIGYVLLSAMLYGLVPIIVKNIYGLGVGVLVTILVRFLVVCFFLGIWVMLSAKYRKQFFKVSKKQILIHASLGVMYLGVIGFYLGSLKFLSVALSVLLMYTYPILVFLYNWKFLGMRFSKIHWLCLMGALLGMGLLLGVDMDNFSLLGIFLAFGSAVSFASYVIVSKTQVSKLNPIILSLQSNIISLTLMIGIWSVFSNESLNFSLEAIVYFMLLGLVCTVFPYLLFLRGLKILGSGQASILGSLEPVFSIFFGVVFLAESISWLQFLGAGILFGGSMILIFLPESD